MKRILLAVPLALAFLWTPAFADNPPTTDGATVVEFAPPASPTTVPDPDWVTSPETAPDAAGAPGTLTPAEPAAEVPTEPEEILGVLGKLAKAARSGEWFLVFALGLIVLVFALRLAADRFEQLVFMKTRWGGWGLTFVGAFASTLGTSLGAGVPFAWAQVWAALSLAFVAAGGFEFVKDAGKKPGE